jgi:hypothetical protein
MGHNRRLTRQPSRRGIVFPLLALALSWLDHFDPDLIGLNGDAASIASAFTQLRLGHPLALEPLSGEASLYTADHAVLVPAFTADNLAHVARTGIRPDPWSNDLQLFGKGG